MFTIKITGVRELDKALRKFAPALQKKILKKGFRKALKPMQAEVKRNTPVRSGDLRKAVKIKPKRSRKGKIEVDVTIGAGNFKGTTFYGAMVELGTHKQEAQHFMKAAFKSEGPKTRDRAIEEIRVAIKETTAEVRSRK